MRTLHATADAFANGRISFSKARALTHFYHHSLNEQSLTSEIELLDLARNTTANHLPRALAAWLNRHTNPADLETVQHRQRSIKHRLEPDGMTTYTLRLPPLQAGTLTATLTAVVMRTRPQRQPDRTWPTLAQQTADALHQILTTPTGGISTGGIVTELVIHIRGDGCTLDDGTPIPDTIVERIAPHAFLRALIHDANRHPINASHRRRHPSTRQKRVVKERDQHCIDCARHDLLQYDHNPPYEQTRHTITDELQLRCAPCHQQRHRNE